MDNLDSVKPDEPVVMTEELSRLFRAAGCAPTVCHACAKPIQVGDVFRLVAHMKPGKDLTDEMCCAKCGGAELTARDSRAAKGAQRGGWGGYSRPSMKE